jgi:hypothetical protein
MISYNKNRNGILKKSEESEEDYQKRVKLIMGIPTENTQYEKGSIHKSTTDQDLIKVKRTRNISELYFG